MAFHEIDSRRLRPAVKADRPFLELMLLEASTGPPEIPRPPLAGVLAEPQTALYIDEWASRPGDAGRIAESARGEPLGAAWYRLFHADRPGYGFIAEDIPELAIGVADGARGTGAGTALLLALIADARAGGHPALSLSVLVINPARHLYARQGFEIVESTDESHTMRLDL